ncbi:MAG: hypothetical protein ACK4RW_01670 [Rehaibacterium terrae]|uniref:hypothetical protein n=1 Tax=Rehaibacterium terrae TaxID=1341696 RepID=UPI003918D272
MRNFPRLLVLAGMLGAVPAMAESRWLYKCEAKADGQVSIQSEPCPPDSREHWRRAVQPEPPAPRTSQAPPPLPTNTAPVWIRESGPTRAQRQAQARRARCEQAKAHARRERDLRWRELKIEDLRRLDRHVAEHCR